ncbi:hypothetical protein [Algivirga pacifica]|uniref:Uncharacterized protein n=1 Tax=Algivirga pacifica TaxID=1162670 RepID=A0ABP9DL55_9BACT
MKSYLNASTVQSRGIRNNNPGNIVQSSVPWKGKLLSPNDTRFEQFKDLLHGLRALFLNLNTYYEKRGLRTIREIVYRYAPPHENHTENYVQHVARVVGIPEDTMLPKQEEVFLRLAKGIVQMENRMEDRHLVTEQDLVGGLQLSGIFTFPGVSYTTAFTESGRQKIGGVLLLGVLVAGYLAWRYYRTKEASEEAFTVVENESDTNQLKPEFDHVQF